MCPFIAYCIPAFHGLLFGPFVVYIANSAKIE